MKTRVKNILLHIPHAGTEFCATQKEHATELLRNAKVLIDYYTDELFAPNVNNEKIIPIVFPFCRTVCDVERMIDDPLEEKNLGIQYDMHSDKPKHGFFCVNGQEYCPTNSIEKYIKHHHLVENTIYEKGIELLIDCHSFSSHPTALMQDTQAAQAYDICIGFNEDRTRPRPEILQTAIEHFEECGYKVGINTPFSNSKTFNTPCHYASFMIEVNKRLYMDQNTLEKGEGFNRLHLQIQALYRKLLG